MLKVFDRVLDAFITMLIGVGVIGACLQILWPFAIPIGAFAFWYWIGVIDKHGRSVR